MNNLTKRQKQLLEELAQGRTNKQIAANMGLTYGTIRQMMHRLCADTGAPNRTALALLYVRQKFSAEKGLPF